jgi:hypothetical protein
MGLKYLLDYPTHSETNRGENILLDNTLDVFWKKTCLFNKNISKMCIIVVKVTYHIGYVNKRHDDF